MGTGNSRYDDAIERYARGEASAKELAAELGVKAQTFHAVRTRRGVPARYGKTGAAHWNWKGGRHITSGGYVRVRVPYSHVLAGERDKDGYVLEHRAVAAQELGRPLASYETVHHIDGNKLNNSADNLQLRLGHHGPNVALRCRHCGSIDLEPYELD